MIKEEWRRLFGFNDMYEVSSFGRIRNTKRGTILSPRERSGGYLAINIGTPKKDIPVHHLVLSLFVGPRFGKEANHKDGDKRNNRADNLEWTSQLENRNHAVKNGLHNTGRGPRRSNLSVSEIKLIRSSKETNVELATKYKVHAMTISRVRNHKVFKNI